MKQRYFPIKAFGFETEAPRWVVTALAVMLVIGIGIVIYQKAYADPEHVILSLKDTNKQLALEVEEYSLHAMEEPEKHELFNDADGKLILRVFRDHCVLIQRQTSRGVKTKLVMDLARSFTASVVRYEAPPLGFLPTVLAQPACQRGCYNPHPGAFKWWYGAQRAGGWVEVWRQWPEGCTHVQMFHPQSGSWDSNPDGSARVKWTCCVH